MRVVLGYATAVECWQAYGQHPALSGLRPSATTNPESRFSVDREFLALMDTFGATVRPLHVLSSKDASRKRGMLVVGHNLEAEYPRGSFCSAGQGVYVSCPELCFLQMASSLSVVKLIELGMELCGTYQPTCQAESDASFALAQRSSPLTSPKRIARYVDHASGPYSFRKARMAQSWVQSGSASPMETFLWMRLCLPPRLGGRGFPLALLNHPFELGAKGKSATGKSFLRCDLFFPESKVAVEYDSDEYHAVDTKIANDSVRRGALECMGIKVVDITRREFFTFNEFEGKARQIARLTGARVRKPTEAQKKARQHLRDDILGMGLMKYRQEDASSSSGARRSVSTD